MLRRLCALLLSLTLSLCVAYCVNINKYRWDQPTGLLLACAFPPVTARSPSSMYRPSAARSFPTSALCTHWGTCICMLWMCVGTHVYTYYTHTHTHGCGSNARLLTFLFYIYTCIYIYSARESLEARQWERVRARALMCIQLREARERKRIARDVFLLSRFWFFARGFTRR